MRIRFLCLYFFWNSITIAEEISKGLLLEHYAFRHRSFGASISKENQKNQTMFAWMHFGNTFSSHLNYNFQFSYLNQKREDIKTFQNTESIYSRTNDTKRILTISPGLNFKYISVYSSLNSQNPYFTGVSIGLNVFPEKSIYLFYRQNPNENTHAYALSIISGTMPAIGLMVAKEYLPSNVEWSGSISLSFKFESYQGGGVYSVENKREENTFFISKIFEENKNSLFEKEINPLESDTSDDFEKEKQKKEWDAKKFQKKEKIIYEVKIEELLKFKIPLVIAIRISRASQSKEEYTELLKKLPPNIVKKCNKIQYDKSKAYR